VTDDFQGRWHFNTCVAAVMQFMNDLYAVEDEIAAGKFPAGIVADAQRKFVLLIAPFAPYLAHELWEVLGEKKDLLRHPWPEYDPVLAKEEETVYAVQVNGKLRSHISVPADSQEAFVRERALADEKVKASVEGKQIVRVIVVPGKLVNIVVK
jgi:leucyl-tRNA synthetase